MSEAKAEVVEGDPVRVARERVERLEGELEALNRRIELLEASIAGREGDLARHYRARQTALADEAPLPVMPRSLGDVGLDRERLAAMRSKGSQVLASLELERGRYRALVIGECLRVREEAARGYARAAEELAAAWHRLHAADAIVIAAGPKTLLHPYLSNLKIPALEPYLRPVVGDGMNYFSALHTGDLRSQYVLVGAVREEVERATGGPLPWRT